MTGKESLISDFLLDVRMRASDALTHDICRWDTEADPADVHEDVRETLAPFFEEIRHRVEGPKCGRRIPLAPNVSTVCGLLAGHPGECVRG